MCDDGLNLHPHLPVDVAMAAQRAIDFHGHLGPYVALGLRMGLLARRRMTFGDHFAASVQAFTGGKPPRSCLVDGLQVATGATLGKGTIEVAPLDEGPVRARVTTDEGTLEIRLSETAQRLCAEVTSRHDAEHAGEHALEMADEALFEVFEVRS